MCDMFLILKTVYFTSYTGGNTPFAVADNIWVVIWSLEGRWKSGHLVFWQSNEAESWQMSLASKY